MSAELPTVARCRAPSARFQKRLLAALTRLRDAAKAQGEEQFLGYDGEEAELDDDGYSKVGRAMVRAIEQADRVIAAANRTS